MIAFCYLRKVFRRYASAYYISLRNSSKGFVEMPSDLYVCREYRDRVFTHLLPYIDVDGYFRNLKKVKSDLEHRNIVVDVDDLYRHSISYQNVSKLIKTMTRDVKQIKHQLKIIMSSEEEDSERVESSAALESRLSETESKLRVAWHEYNDLEKSFIIPFLQLPNNLHKHTRKEDEVLFSLFAKPRFPFDAKSHMEIGSLRGELYFADVSPTSYFMKGRLALLELALGDFILSRFSELGFRNYCTVDVVKAVIVEGCAIDTKVEGRRILKIADSSNLYSNHTRILVGSASLPSLIVLLYHGTLNFAFDSPIRFISVGQKYQVESDLDPKISSDPQKSLFTALQSTCASGLVAYPADMSEEVVLNEIAMILTQIYTELGLHFILVQYGAPKLRTNESLAIGVRMYSPYYETYVEVGRISLYQDYISKRLQIYQSLEKKKAAFLRMIFVEILDMKSWIGCMMENAQTLDGDFVIPKCLQPHMYR